jgi:hypothetical protein
MKNIPRVQLICIIVLATASLGAMEVTETTSVRGFVGEAAGGFRQSWHSHLGDVMFSGVRKNKENGTMQWNTAPVPQDLAAPTVTFVWAGAMGIGPSNRGDFTISVNRKEAVDFDVVMQPTEFPGRTEDCRLVFNVLYAPAVQPFAFAPGDASGIFYLTVPKSWIKPGEPAALQVRARDRDSRAWFSVLHSDAVPLFPANRVYKKFLQVEKMAQATPPFPGEEASYEWYRRQYDETSILTPIGPPGDPADLGVSSDGQLMYGNDRVLPGTPFVMNALAFAVVDGGRVVPFGWEPTAHQELIEGVLPIVRTLWRYEDWEIAETAFGRPLRGDAYSSGLESTLGWAVFDVTNRATQPREFTLLTTRMGNNEKTIRDLTYRDGVIMEGGSARFSAKSPPDFTAEFLPVFPMNEPPDEKNPLELLRRGGMYRALALRGTIAPGETKRLAVNGVFDFQNMVHWKAVEQPPVTPQELLVRDADMDLAAAEQEWKKLAQDVSRFTTPDEVLNRLLVKGTLDGYELTKRWNGKRIAIDSVCYRCQWDDTSMKWIYALDLMGNHLAAERLLDTVFTRQGQRKPAGIRTREGSFSDVTNIERDGSDASWASCNGWALCSMAQHARLSNDKKWLENHKQAILDGCQWIRRERAFSKEKPDNPCAGLIYGKFVCDLPDQEGPGGVGYFTYTDAISYLGIHEMGLLLKEWGYPEGEDLLREADLYRRDIVAAVDRLTDNSTDPWFIPWDLSAPKLDDPYFNGACGPINLAYGGVLPRTDPRIDHAIRWNIDRTHKGSPERSATKSMFYSQELAITLLELGREEEFLRMFYTVLAANISPETLTTFEWWSNTQPHLHSVSSMIRMARTMLLQERDGALYLLQGVPCRWYEQGKEIKISAAPTNYGLLLLQVRSDLKNDRIRVHLDLPERIEKSPVKLCLRLPNGRKIVGVTVDGREHADFDNRWIVLKTVSGKLDITVRVAILKP